MSNQDDERVFVAWLHPMQNYASFTTSLLDMQAYDSFRENRQIASIKGYESGVNVSTPRNEVVLDFLSHRDEPWCLLVDADMTFPADAVERLLQHADPEKVPILGGLCFGVTSKGVLWPTLYELTELEEGPAFARVTQFPMSQPLLKVSGTGAAFLLVHRSVFEAVRSRRFPEDPGHHYPWFQETQLSAGPLGEDLTFMFRAGICGFPVHVLTSLHIGHLKHQMLTAYRYFEQEGRIVERPPDEPGQPAPVRPRPTSPAGSGQALPESPREVLRRGHAVTAVPQ